MTADERSWLVVGAGSAGCVVAARLAEDRDSDVTLVEAGPDLLEGSVPPEVAGASFFGALGSPGRTFGGLLASHVDPAIRRPYQRGRGLGGSSTVNAMVTLRGDGDLYRSWGWDDVDAAWEQARLPTQEAADDELGAVDLALLAADPLAVRAPLARRGGTRVTAAETMLWPVRGQSNLTIRTDSPVTRVVVEQRRAVGVELVDGTRIDADRVVLCAGAIHSPAMLLRSGVDTPGVGEGLQDHPSAAFTLALRPEAVADPSTLTVGALLTRGDVQFLPMNHLGPAAPGYGLLMVALMRPVGRAGTVRLNPDLPDGEPIVDFALLRDPRDLAALVGGVHEAMMLLHSPAFAEIVDVDTGVFIDAQGTRLDALVSDADIERWLHAATGDYVHASSTCAMGAVVDDDGAVFGYDGLYVCDASVFPSIPDVNTHGPTTMLAERLTARWRR